MRAFQTLVQHIPVDAGIAWVLVLHMAPDRPSELSAILSKHTDLPVTEVLDEMPVEPDHVYVIAPGRTMTIAGGLLRPLQDHDPGARRTSIDAFLLSLAAECGERAGCALLSGAGTDGTLGLKAVKEAGGITLTQSLSGADYDSMLLSAVRTGLVDRELPVAEIPDTFAAFLGPRQLAIAEKEVGDGERRHIADLLHLATDHDFSDYKASTVDRRVRRRMQVLGLTSLHDYLARLEKDKDETLLLFRDLLIGVTQFFRDPEAFEAVSRAALPDLLQRRSADDELRVWVPGCATGEEAYSLAILLLEHVERMDSPPAVRVFGSDIDENALHVARLARYPKSIAADVSPERLERHFDSEDGTYCIRRQVRELCLFAQHNMLRDPPFSRIDLISCRNVLIYMNADLQRRLLPVFHYALRPDGFLLLGPAENANQPPRLFRERDRGHRLYQRIGAAGQLPDFPITPAGRMARRARAAAPRPADRGGDGLASGAAHRVLAAFAPAYAVIDADLEIVELSGGTGAFLELPGGRPRTNLAAMARDGLALEMKSTVAKAISTGRREERTGLAVGAGPEQRHFTLIVEPLPPGSRGRRPGEALYLVVFQDAPAPRKPQALPPRAPGDEVARALEAELQATRERLQTTMEELETSNEELRSSNEELSSVNEELQSSNEELETSKEELQSINEELRTVNAELNSRVDELSGANNDLKNLLANTEIAMLFLDEDFLIKNFTPQAKALFRLRDHDLGRPLDELAGRVDSLSLKDEVRAVVRDGIPVEREVQTDGGQEAEVFIMRILPYRDQEERIGGAVLTFVDITERKRSELRLANMVSELNHRAKNALAGVQAIMRQTQRRAPSVDAFAEILMGRLRAMAESQNLLSDREWEEIDLQDLAAGQLGSFVLPGSIALAMDGPKVAVRPQSAVTMGLILHELGTNAVKYGAWSRPGGRVDLTWRPKPDDASRLQLTWAESGGPPATAPAGHGFGLGYILQAVRYELRGTCQTEFTAEGFRCTLELPADRLRWGEAAQPSAAD